VNPENHPTVKLLRSTASFPLSLKPRSGSRMAITRSTTSVLAGTPFPTKRSRRSTARRSTGKATWSAISVGLMSLVKFAANIAIKGCTITDGSTRKKAAT